MSLCIDHLVLVLLLVNGSLWIGFGSNLLEASTCASSTPRDGEGFRYV